MVVRNRQWEVSLRRKSKDKSRLVSTQWTLHFKRVLQFFLLVNTFFNLSSPSQYEFKIFNHELEQIEKFRYPPRFVYERTRVTGISKEIRRGTDYKSLQTLKGILGSITTEHILNFLHLDLIVLSNLFNGKLFQHNSRPIAKSSNQTIVHFTANSFY